MQHYKSIHVLLVAALLLAAAGTQAWRAGREPSYMVARPEFDYTITEVPGLNYVCLDKLPETYLPPETFPGHIINGTPVEPGDVWLSIVGDMFWGAYVKKLREAGVEYLYARFDKGRGTPTIRLGVYRPDNETIQTIVSLVSVAADEVERLIDAGFSDPGNVEDALKALQVLRSVRIQIAEVYAHAGMTEKLRTEAIQLREALANGTLKPPLSLDCCIWETVGGWIHIETIYGEGEPPRELLVEVFREIRRVVDPEVAVVLIVWSSYPWGIQPPIIPIPTNQTITTTTTVTATSSQTEASEVKVVVEVQSTTTSMPQDTTTLIQSPSTTGVAFSGGGEAQAKWLGVAVAVTLILLAAAWLKRG